MKPPRTVFAADGFITETLHFGFNNGQPIENDHWWFDHGTPAKRQSSGAETVKEGDLWKTSPRQP